MTKGRRGRLSAGSGRENHVINARQRDGRWMGGWRKKPSKEGWVGEVVCACRTQDYNASRQSSGSPFLLSLTLSLLSVIRTEALFLSSVV